MTGGLQANSPRRRRRGHRWRSRSNSPSFHPKSTSPSGSNLPSSGPKVRTPSPMRRRGGNDFAEQARPRPYMKQVKLHPSGCQQWSSQVVDGGGVYFAYASTLTTYVYDTRNYSLVTILGGNDCNIHSLLWNPQNPHRLVVFSIDGRGSEWDIRCEERVAEFDVGRPPICSAWDPFNEHGLAVITKGSNMTYILRTGGGQRPGNYNTGYSRSNRDPSLAATCAKWSRYQPGTLAVGWTDGRVSFTDESCGATTRGTANNSKSQLVSPNEGCGSVVDLRHDPNGGAYVLVAYSSGSVILWDAVAHWCMSSFDRCAVGLVGVRWMAWAPGNFLALSSKTPIAKVFTISQNNVIGTVCLGDTGSGIRDMAWLPSQATTDGTESQSASRGPRAICGFRDGSLTVANVRFGGGTNGIGCNGNLGLDAVTGGSIPWASKAGHIETVFTCAHRPGDADTLATGSYGSSVKVWHTPTMDLKVTLTGQTGAIYSVDWSLDGDKIASSSREGTVWIWDAESGKAEKRLSLHSRGVHRVQWDPFHRTRLASAGADKNLIVFSETGVVERAYVHPAPLFGCHWCPSCSGVIATACQDGNVRVFDVSFQTGVEPQYILSGHSQRVFTVCWSPLLHGTLASGSDDTTVIIWCLGAGAIPKSNPADGRRKISPSAVLRGHTSNVRPLHWNAELPWLLLSGSWDGTIRAWDIRRAGVGRNDFASTEGNDDQRNTSGAAGGDACIAVMNDHVADVYGISAADDRPFLYASTSRDTTLRQFTLEGVVSSIKTRAVIANSLACCLGDIKESMRPDSALSLCGQASKALQVKLREVRRDSSPPFEASRRIFDFFWGSDGVNDLWEVLRWVIASAENGPEQNGSARSSIHKKGGFSYSRLQDQHHLLGQEGNDTGEGVGVGHSCARTKTDTKNTVLATTSLREVPKGLMWMEERVLHRNARRASARALATLLNQSSAFLIQDRRLRRTERLERAARQFLTAGDLRSLCETLVKLGRWERALAVAPGVGMGFWKSLAERYAEFLRSAGGAGGPSVGYFCDAQGDSVNGTSGAEDSITMAVSLLVATGRPSEALEILKGSDEAYTLAVSVADGVFPAPAFPEELKSTLPGASAEPGVTALGVQQGLGRGKIGEGIEMGERLGGSRREAKLLALLDEQVSAKSVQTVTGPGGRDHDSRTYNHRFANEGLQDEGKASPKQEDPDFLGNLARNKPCRFRAKCLSAGCGGDKTCCLQRELPNAALPKVNHEAYCTQRELANAALRKMTEDRAESFFRESKSALAAAALLSECDGSQSAAVPALSLLIRGEEPDLAYAAARALRFPTRELNCLVREMARRAEAWGDPRLATELMLNADGDDMADGDNIYGGGAVNAHDDHCESVADGAKQAYWHPSRHGTAGAPAGSLEVAFVALRAGAARENSSASPSSRHRSERAGCLAMKLRSKASYLDDAEGAFRRGKDVEAVQLLVLSSSMERAANHAIAFLRDTLMMKSPTPSPSVMSTHLWPGHRLSRRSLNAALAVTRALGSGLSSTSIRLPARLRKQVLAYASYVGALEAASRGYHTIVGPLLRNACLCCQAVERFHSKSIAENMATLSRSDNASTDRTESSETRSLSPSPSLPFPPCMSTGALVIATVLHLTGQTSSPDDGQFGNAAEIVERAYEEEVSLRIARKIREAEGGALSAVEANKIDDVISSTERRISAAGERAAEGPENTCADGYVSSGTGSLSTSSTCVSEGKARHEGMHDKKHEYVSSRTPSNTPGGGFDASREITIVRQEIICGGSQLPSCRRHERVAWRSADSKPMKINPLAMSEREFGQQTWPLARGATFLLEDGETRMGLSNAIMWAKVNPFSPLNTGCRIMPF